MTRHTDKEIAQAAGRFERFADTLDPETAEAKDTDDLRAIATAAEVVRADDARLREAVRSAAWRTRDLKGRAPRLSFGISRSRSSLL
jgi:hypothetical protein